MFKYLRKILKFMFSRVVIVSFMILVELVMLVAMMWKFNDYFIYFQAANWIVGITVSVHIINTKYNPAYKIAWIVPILLFPFPGAMIYLIFSGNKMPKKLIRKMAKIDEIMKENLLPRPDTEKKLFDLDYRAGVQSRYITKYANCPPYENSTAKYFPLGEDMFEDMIRELSAAKKFIFLEYFIIDNGKMWDAIFKILCEKVEAGVDVRVIYDDMGTIMLLPIGFAEKLKAAGIKCQVFNPYVPILTSRLNNRNHRKICVIDGDTAFTGGINIGDEYINGYEKHGHWKDTAVMVKGKAVYSFTVMFLTMWDYLCGEQVKPENSYESYKPSDEICAACAEAPGFVQPYTDNPLDNEPVGETIYLNMINRAEKYLYISTPYLIIDNEMATSLIIAAKSNVDVRILTPHVWDKRFVHVTTRANYQRLIQNGVRIYEYTPGFNHAKLFVSDDLFATVGTVNLDYRSLYLHFECGTWLCGNQAVADIKQDFLKTLEVSQEITQEYCDKMSGFEKFCQKVLTIFAPLL